MDSSPTLILVTISRIRAKNFAILLLTAFEQVLSNFGYALAITSLKTKCKFSPGSPISAKGI